MKVSVLMPVRNRLEQLELALPTVYAQNPDEVVAVDDGSTDGSTEFLQQHDLVYVRREQERYSRHQGATWTACGDAATGDVLIWQNAEIYHPGAPPDSFQRLLERLELGAIAFGVVYDCPIARLDELDFDTLPTLDWEMKGDGRGIGGRKYVVQGCRMYCENPGWKWTV